MDAVLCVTPVNNLERATAMGMVAVAMLVVAWRTLQGFEQAEGNLISVLSAGIGYYLRGKVQSE